MEDKKHRFDGKEDRNYHQKPFDDVSDKLGQIDEESASIADKTEGTGDATSNNEAQSDEINDSDDRDHGDSTRDWDAENNRTGRHK
ncbi:MAG: hypothetical protein EOO01_22230 [Chitinophagaceae bacterium]|nr:MAG: hypothetical protein EOO01_22230 [Chitinophagaceae bacterium]